MLILQQWEPIVSSLFASQITFGVKICGIPFHYKTELTIKTIGDELGHVSARDDNQGRIRVQVNGVEPLIMRMEICVPSEKFTTVKFEYENLENSASHAFFCLMMKKIAISPMQGWET